MAGACSVSSSHAAIILAFTLCTLGCQPKVTGPYISEAQANAGNLSEAEQYERHRESLKPRQAEPGGKRIIFVGNSYTYSNNLPGLVEELAKASGHPRPLCESVTLPGAAVEDHLLPGREKHPQAVRKGPWDYVIFQQGPSAKPESQQLLIDGMKRWAPIVKESGGKPAMFMVWPEERRKGAFVGVHKGYFDAAREIDGIFLPAGDAWFTVLNKTKSITLYSSDELHPTMVGTYLAGITITSKLYDVSADKFPAKIEWRGGNKVDITSQDAAILFAAANDAVKKSAEAEKAVAPKAEPKAEPKVEPKVEPKAETKKK